MNNVWGMPVQPEAFMILWREAKYVVDVAVWLRLPVAAVRAAARFLREAGCDLPRKDLIRAQAMAKQLVEAWQAAQTPEGVAIALKWPIQRVLRVAGRLRRKGVYLKRLPHHPGYFTTQMN
jgi:hypothetical protein